MIRNNNDLYRELQTKIAPLYFFDANPDTKNLTLKEREVSTNGTVTLFRTKQKTFGITNFHVYKGYLDYKKSFENSEHKHQVVCQIGYSCNISLEDRILYQDANSDLAVFFLASTDLEAIGKKGAFTELDERLEEYLKDQKEDDPSTWNTSFAGYPGKDKITKIVGDKRFEKDFGIFLSTAPATHDFQGNIVLNFGEVRYRINEKEIVLDKGFLENNSNLGGISGGPVFGPSPSNQFGLSLFGIIFKGSGSDFEGLNETGNLVGLELIYAKPITTCLKDILLNLS